MMAAIIIMIITISLIIMYDHGDLDDPNAYKKTFVVLVMLLVILATCLVSQAIMVMFLVILPMLLITDSNYAEEFWCCHTCWKIYVNSVEILGKIT